MLHAILHNGILCQSQWGSSSRHQMTASPFLDSTCVYCKKEYKIPHSSPSSWPVYYSLVLSSLLWSNLVKKFIFQVPPQINRPFDQEKSIVKLRKDTFSFFCEGFGDVSHCKNLSLGMLSTSANCSHKACAEIHLRIYLCSMISNLPRKMPARPPQLNYKVTLLSFFLWQDRRKWFTHLNSLRNGKFLTGECFDSFTFFQSHDIHSSFKGSLPSRERKLKLG